MSPVVSGFVFVNRCFGLIRSPYRTMRNIAGTSSLWEAVWMFGLIGCYFIWSQTIRFGKNFFLINVHSAINLTVWVLVTALLSTIYVSFLSERTDWRSFGRRFVLWVYTLLPTLMWFSVASMLYLLIPPPRTGRFLGDAFGLLFLIFSVTMLLWRGMLFFLAIRFVTKSDFTYSIFVTVIYLAWIVPYSLFLYSLLVFRIPFV